MAIKKAARKTGSAREVPPPAPRAAERGEQIGAFEKGIRLFHQRKFAEAKAAFQKALVGANAQIAHNAGMHIRVCDQRLAPAAPQLSTAEDHYNYAVAMINARNLGAARTHLETALRTQPKADHIHYALALCRGLAGDLAGAGESLKRAVDLDPRNRQTARRDPDFASLLQHPAVAAAL
jgi:tetratricopeptide (TPR) repeat protein